MLFEPLTLVVILANLLGATMAIPQARKLLQTRRVDGVSITWAAASAAVNAWWAVYGIGVGDLGIVPVSVVSVVAYLVIGIAIVRFSDAPGPQLLTRSAATVAGVTTVPVVALLLHGWFAAGIALGALYGIQLLPAVVGVYRAVDVSGVSPATWLIAFVEAVLWGVYGFARLDAGLLALAATGSVMSSLVLARLFVRRPRRTWGAQPAGVPGFATV